MATRRFFIHEAEISFRSAVKGKFKGIVDSIIPLSIIIKDIIKFLLLFCVWKPNKGPLFRSGLDPEPAWSWTYSSYSAAVWLKGFNINSKLIVLWHLNMQSATWKSLNSQIWISSIKIKSHNVF